MTKIVNIKPHQILRDVNYCLKEVWEKPFICELDLYRVILPYACFGLLCDSNGKIIEAPPIAKWCEGQHIQQFYNWVARKQGQIHIVR